MGGHLPRFTQLVTTEASAWAPVCLTPEVTLPVTVLSCLQGALWPDFFKEQLTVLCGLCQMFRGWHICCQYYLYWLSECLLWKCCSYDISFVDAKEICHFAMPDYLHSLLGGIRENPRDGGAWWATIYGVTQSWTWLKWLSSSSSSKGDVAVVGCRFFISFFLRIYERAHPYTCRDWILWFKIVLAIKCKSCDLKFPFITGDIEFVCVCVCVFICGWMMSTHMGESHLLCSGCQLECKFFWKHFTTKPRSET